MSGLTHLAGAVLATAGLTWLIEVAVARSAWHVVAATTFGVSMILLYLASALYHLLPLSEVGIARLRRLDHSMIYVFIAGCYTPVCLVTLRGSLGWTVFGIVWTLALAGVVLKLVALERSRWVRIGLYLGLGWLAVIIVPALWRTLSSAGLAWMFAGGAAYTIGSLVYALRRPDPFPRVLGFHEIWHVFVLGGSACHFFMIKDGVLAA